MQHSLSHRRTAVFAMFFLPGLSFASWVSRTPDIRDLLDATTAEMGLVLLGLSAGSMVGVVFSGRLVMSFGTRVVTLAGLSGIALSGVSVGAGSYLGESIVVALGLALFGLGMGTAEIALNIEAAELERIMDRSVLPAMHGFFSLGTLGGALVGIAANVTDAPPILHLSIASAVVVAVAVVAIRFLPSHTQVSASEESHDGAKESLRTLLRDRTLLLISAVILAMALAEGTANDWLPLVMVDGHGLDATTSSAIYAGFTATMAFGRFAGGRYVDQYGRAWALNVSAIFAAAGIGLVSLSDYLPLAIFGALLWGLGVALGFPVALSAAAASGPNNAARMSVAATIGYLAFLVGPPALGFLGEHFGLRPALLVVLALVLLAAFATPAAKQAHTTTEFSSAR